MNAAEIRAEITEAVEELAKGPNQFVKLSSLRWKLAFIRTAGLDAQLAAMYRARVINLIEASSPRSLTADDRAAALRIGGQDKTLVALV